MDTPQAGPSPAATAQQRIRIVVDDREPRPGIADAVGALWDDVAIARLDAGDISIGARVLIERKTVSDFVISVEDGRLFRQAWAMAQACHAPLLIVEGEDALDAARLAPRALRGVILTLLTGYRVPMLRTESVEETAEILVHIAEQEGRRAARAGRPAEPRPARAAFTVLASVPGVGDRRARRLLRSLGTVRQVIEADDDTLLDVPEVGPATVRAIRRAFDAEEASPSGPPSGAPSGPPSGDTTAAPPVAARAAERTPSG